MTFNSNIKIGILGGGQLGRMLLQAAVDLDLSVSILDPDADAPCALTAPEFQQGNIRDYKTVYEWGKNKDLITIEIENVNLEALEQLEKEGKKVFPQPRVLRIIQDKRVQKEFYKSKQIPTSEFVLIESKDQLAAHKNFLPAFQKLGTGGYDGRGVYKIASEKDFAQALEGPGLLEKLVDYEKEISVIVARNEKGETVTFPTVEMVFHPVHHLVEYLFSPANLSEALHKKASEIAVNVINQLEMVGLLAVEMFLTKDGQILVNEIAPRPHNSGHQTIEGNMTSQYEQHLRAILGLPLGDTSALRVSAMVNLLGEEGYSGPAKYSGADKILSVKGVYLHLYGKKMTKPFRKMGHVTILGEDIADLKKKADFVKETIKVIS